MQVQSMFFKRTSSMKLDDPVLQRNMKKAKGKFVDLRAKSVVEIETGRRSESARRTQTARSTTSTPSCCVRSASDAARHDGPWAEDGGRRPAGILLEICSRQRLE